MPLQYDAYIRSAAWRAKRRAFFASALPSARCCYVCSAPRRPGFHVHHRTYTRFGMERLTDLVGLCPSCHEELHDFHRSSSHDLWRATRLARKRYLRGPSAPSRSSGSGSASGRATAPSPPAQHA